MKFANPSMATDSVFAMNRMSNSSNVLRQNGRFQRKPFFIVLAPQRIFLYANTASHKIDFVEASSQVQCDQMFK